MATLMPTPYQVVLDGNGSPISGSLIWTTIAQTTTPAATFTDAAGLVPNTNPIIADSSGRFVAYLPAGQSFRFVYEAAAIPPAHGEVITTVDNVLATPSSSVNLDVTGAAGEALAAGSAVYLSAGLGSKTAGLWYLADNTNSFSSSAAVSVGVVPATIASGASGSIRLAGIVPGFTALTIGGAYYVGTAGAVTTTVPSNARLIGTADTTTTVVLSPNVPPTTTVVPITATGTQNNYAPGVTGPITVFRLANATDLTITGIVAGYHGQIIQFIDTGAGGNTYFKHQNAGSSVANRLTNFATSGDTPISKGTATFQYDATSTTWRLTQHDQGAFITPTFSAGNFTGSGSMTWTVGSGDVTTLAYLLRGRTLTILMELAATTVGGTVSTNLNISNAAYGGFTQAKNVTMPCIINDNAAGFAAGHALFGPIIGGSATSISLFKLPTGNWTLSTDNTTINGSFVVEVT